MVRLFRALALLFGVVFVVQGVLYMTRIVITFVDLMSLSFIEGTPTQAFIGAQSMMRDAMVGVVTLLIGTPLVYLGKSAFQLPERSKVEK